MVFIFIPKLDLCMQLGFDDIHLKDNTLNSYIDDESTITLPSFSSLFISVFIKMNDNYYTQCKLNGSKIYWKEKSDKLNIFNE